MTKEKMKKLLAAAMAYATENANSPEGELELLARKMAEAWEGEQKFFAEEKGNILLTVPETGRLRAYIKIGDSGDKMIVLSIGYCAEDYPSLTVWTKEMSPQEIADQINEYHQGWVVKKLNLVPEGSVTVVDNMVGEVEGI